MIDRLRLLPGFDALDEDALAVIVARSSLRTFAPDHVIFTGGVAAEMLIARIDGALIGAGGTPAPAVFDAPSLLFGLPMREDYRAGPAGLTAFAIAKPHVFTIAREFPEFIVSLTQRGTAE